MDIQCSEHQLFHYLSGTTETPPVPLASPSPGAGKNESDANDSNESDDTDDSESEDTKALIAEWHDKDCPSCGAPMAWPDPSLIDWAAVHKKAGNECDEDYPYVCEDCTCGACGQRKRWPGDEHC